ncbi:enoyl-CoA hydratase/isomerase family protein [Eudoraea chungangensis]|uniref:enoyl-CoA hydratase/isomerase family protein n=1 Tax=Eudoraea chungangensis TaxID=1481905 RepID=UPI0023EB2260|nr:enoyl-CoA hydratase-related protein [Eudoraea chungangensis]
MTYTSIEVHTDYPTATITINRPAKLNALNKETIKELSKALKKLDENNRIRVILITGKGEKAFVAGADISEFSDYSVKQGKELSAKGHKSLFDYIENLGTPVIALINGFALGGGLELAMACHFRIASTNAKMGLPEVSLGVIPGYGGTQRLPQLIGKGRALELIMTANMIDAHRAKEIGLVNHVVPMEELLEKGLKTANSISKNSPVAISYAIKAVNAGFNHNMNGYKTEIDAFGDCFGTKDFKEGTQAFLGKRKADFPGV